MARNGDPLRIEGVKGKANFIHRQVERIGRLLFGGSAGLGISAARFEKQGQKDQAGSERQPKTWKHDMQHIMMGPLILGRAGKHLAEGGSNCKGQCCIHGDKRMKCAVRVPRFLFFSLPAILIFIPQCRAQFAANPVSPGSAYSIPQAQLIQPEALSRLLRMRGPDKPLILQVGSHVMFEQAHIPGAEYAGPGSQPSGLSLLESKLASARKDRFIVLYCGCCPWNHCPNVGPAYHRSHELGFTHVKVLYLANNFGDDWVNKGYPADHGE